MRVLAFLLALCAAGAAFAQDAAPGFGPYRFGMSPEEARAAAPGEWRDLDAVAGFSARGGPAIRIGVQQFSTMLRFDEGRLSRITLVAGGVAESSERCDENMTDVLERLAREGGPFNGSRTISEFHSEGVETTLPGGSIVRRYNMRSGEVHTLANRPGAAFAEVTERYGRMHGADAELCIIQVNFSATAPLTEAELRAGAPTQAELENAQLITPAPWIRRPDAQSFARYYPTPQLEAGIGGRVDLMCLVVADGSLRCVVASEEPAEHGFGMAALAIARDFQMAGETEDGTPTTGGRVRIPLRFNVTQ
jgi:TonB family protein